MFQTQSANKPFQAQNKKKTTAANPLQTVLNSYNTPQYSVNGQSVQMPTYEDFMNMQPKKASIDDLSDIYGFDYSRDYAVNQANAIKRAKEDGLQGQLRAIDNNVRGQSDSMDRKYYLEGLQNRQSMAETGRNAGISQDQNLRLAMSRQAEMGDIYRDANTREFSVNNELSRLPAEALAYADELYNNRRQQGFNNLQVHNQGVSQDQAAAFGNYMDMWKMLENVKGNDRAYNLEQGSLTGNYISTEAQPLLEDLMKAKSVAENPNSTPEQRQAASATAEDVRNKLASMGYDTSKFSSTTSLDDMRGNMNELNYTMPNQQRLFENGVVEGELTGNYVPQEARGLIESLLNAKQVAENPQSSPQQREQAHATANDSRTKLASMGIDPSSLGAGTSMINALSNAAGLNSTLGKVAQDNEIAFKKGQMTGQYTDPQNTKLLNQLLELKYQAENGHSTPETSQQADMIRQQLAANGVDVSKFGSNVGLSQALKNAQGLGGDTFDKYAYDSDRKDKRYEFDNELKFGYDELKEQGRQFDSGLEYDYYNTDMEKSMFDSELAENSRQFDVDSALKSRGLDIDEMLAMLEEEKLNYGGGELKIDPYATNQYNAQISKFDNLDDALDYVAENADEMAANGADLSKVRSYIEKQFKSEINKRNKEAQNSMGAGDDWLGKP